MNEELLELKFKNTEDVYTFTYTDEDCKPKEVTIFFKNKLFKDVRFPFDGSYTKYEWCILNAIYLKIMELEKAYEEKQNGQ